MVDVPKRGGAGRGALAAIVLVVMVLVAGCLPLVVSTPLLAPASDGPAAVRPPASGLAAPLHQTAVAALACVSSSSGAGRFVNPGATPGGAGMNRTCSASESLVQWTATGTTPTVQACVNTSSDAGRFINLGAAPGGSGMNRGCRASEQLVTWGMGGATPP